MARAIAPETSSPRFRSNPFRKYSLWRTSCRSRAPRRGRAGAEGVEGRVGVDATGQAFNSIVAIEQHKGKEMNPFVNPGAIATTSMIKGATADQIWMKIIGTYSD